MENNSKLNCKSLTIFKEKLRGILASFFHSSRQRRHAFVITTVWGGFVLNLTKKFSTVITSKRYRWSKKA